MRFNRSLKKILEDGQPSTYNLQDTAYNIQKKKLQPSTYKLQLIQTLFISPYKSDKTDF